LQRHLTAFETDFVEAATSGFLAFMTSSASFAHRTADTPAYASGFFA
jgi:hypothetical protein